MTDARDARGTTPLDQSMLQATGAFWQFPAILFTAWWNAVTAPWLPAPASPARWHSAHDQLVVPEPLEEAGEHALFA